MKLEDDFIYDIETFKDAFTLSIVRGDGQMKARYEVSRRKNELSKIIRCLDYLKNKKKRMVGFNNLGFDYPILHEVYEQKDVLLTKSGVQIAKRVYSMAQKQIESFSNGFGNTIPLDEHHVKQVDLYRIWHFNNKAKSTGLKMLQFNMRLENIEDLPYAPDQDLEDYMIDEILDYNDHDVESTRQFYLKSKSQIEFRDSMSAKLGKDFTNADDTKIGAEYFQMRLQEAGVKLYEYKNGKRQMKQTPRDKIVIKDCLFPYLKFTRPEFKAVHEWFTKQVIRETKGVFSDIEEHRLGDVAKYAEMVVKRKKFKTKPTQADLDNFKELYPLGWIEEVELKATEYLFDKDGNHVTEYPLDSDGCPDLSKKPKKVRVPKKAYWGCWKVAETLNVKIDGFRLDFGVGGIHGSLLNTVVKSDNECNLVDYDVSSFYPNMAISNRIYPEHLGETFCDIYKDIYEQRKSYDKKSAENAMLKLALNGCYGKSNDKYSVFYDPKFTMSITISGQLTLCMLIDMFYQNNLKFEMVMANTDGITVKVSKEDDFRMDEVVKEWEKVCKLQMERADYATMWIRDVNNYLSSYKE